MARRVLGRMGVAALGPRMERLAGYTNRVYAVETTAGRLCLRIPGARTETLIDRRLEAENARKAAAAGVAPAVLYADPAGVMMTPFVAAKALSAHAFAQDGGAILRAADALRRLHDRAEDFVNSFSAFAWLDRYAALLRDECGGVPPDLAEAIGDAANLRDALAANPVPLRPCHCDPTGSNLLDTGERVWLIDWEYSGMNDPMWDLAYLSLEARFDAGQDAVLLASYLGRLPAGHETARMAAQKAACELLAAAWALVQAAGGNKAADFRAYATAALRSCRARRHSAALRQALKRLPRGETAALGPC